jgi:hypothetical protein
MMAQAAPTDFFRLYDRALQDPIWWATPTQAISATDVFPKAGFLGRSDRQTRV